MAHQYQNQYPHPQQQYGSQGSYGQGAYNQAQQQAMNKAYEQGQYVTSPERYQTSPQQWNGQQHQNFPRGGRQPHQQTLPYRNGPPNSREQYHDGKGPYGGSPRGHSRERARQPVMQPESTLAMSFDNPFPVFPNNKKQQQQSPAQSSASPSNQQWQPNRFPRASPMNSNNAQSRPGQMSDRATLQKRHGSDPMVNNHTPNAHPQDMQRLRDGQNLPRSQTSGPAQNYNRPDANDPNWPVPQQGHPQRSMTMPVELDSEPNARNFSRPPQQAQPRQNLQRQGPSQPRGYGEAQHDYRAAQQQQQQTPINTQVGQYNQDQYFSPKSQYQGIGREASIEEEMPNFANSPDDGSLHGDGTLDNQQVPMQPAYHPYGSSAQDELYLPAAQPNLQSSYQSPNPSRSLQKSRSHPNIRGQAQAGAGGAIHEMPGSVPQVPPLPQAHVNSPYVGNAYYEPGRGSSGSQYSNTQYPQRQNSGPPLAQGGWNGYSEQGAYPQPAYGYPPQPNGYYAHENHTSSAPPGPGFAPPQRSMTGQTAAGNNYGPAPFRRRASQDSTYARNAPSYSTPNIHENPDSLPHNPLPARPATANQRPIHPQAFTRLPPSRVHSNPVSTQAQIPPQSNLPPAQKTAAPPITYGELQRLRGVARASPTNSSHQLILAKKLVEASVVLVDDGGRADAKMKAKNRERYLSEACKIVKKLAHSGYPDAMFYLADCYTTGKLGLAPDPKEAFGMYQGAAKAGHANAAYRTAVCCEIGSEQGGGTRKDPLKAIQWYKRAAQLGDVPAMYKLGVILLRGLLGQQQNVAESLSWLKKAAYLADDENPHALHELGQLYSDAGHAQGKIQPNEQYAFNYFRKAAELQYKFAQYRLGKCYEYGLLGCPVEPRCSIAWYSRAAAQGEHEAELSLSGWYLTGCGSILEQSDTEAFLWARKAAVAEPPLPKAMFAMGYFHEVGIGCARSLDEAKRWYTRAASYKFPKAQLRLEELKKGGDKVQKSREKLARGDQKQNEADCTVM